MGDIPLEFFLPFYVTPWVFTYNGRSPRYDYMLQAAVATAVKVAKLTPFCLYDGSTSDPIYKWLVRNGVTLMQYNATWRSKIDEAFPKAYEMRGFSPLYLSTTSLFGAYQRMDIPMLPQLDQYNYALFTDSDVLFLRRISLLDFPLPLPKSMSMAFEMDDRFPCNAGVMLMNLPRFRETHDGLVESAFRNPTLHYGDYGPLDQGAFNQFYEKDMESRCTLSETFNTKPYKNNMTTDTYVVHLHGPKPLDYLDYATQGTCKFVMPDRGNLCALGLPNICRIVLKLIRRRDSWSFESEIAVPTIYSQLHEICSRSANV
jgi:hypothetical protein